MAFSVQAALVRPVGPVASGARFAVVAILDEGVPFAWLETICLGEGGVTGA